MGLLHLDLFGWHCWLAQQCSCIRTAIAASAATHPSRKPWESENGPPQRPFRADCKSGFINARSETVATKPAYKHAFKSRRCLILADGFFEWQKVANGKQPWYFTLKDDRPFAFAGIWSTWHKGAEPPHPRAPSSTCAIITTSANSVLEPYHDRMPVILRESDLATWLDPHLGSGTSPAGAEQEQRLLGLLAPFDPAEMSARRVSRLVNSPKNSSPDCIAEERELLA